MRTIRPITHSRRHRPNSRAPRRRRTPPSEPPSEVKLLLVDFRSGEAVRRHPDLQPWLDANWRIRSATPRLVERGLTKLLVVLERPVVDVSPSNRLRALPS